MKDELVGVIFFIGGIGVLLSYLLLYKSGAFVNLVDVFSSRMWKVWILSMIITVLSVLYVYYYYVFEEEMEGWKRTLFVVSTFTFLISAISWSISINYLAKHKDQSTLIERIPLNVTALATIGILIAVLYSKNNTILILASIIIVIHHLIFDALIWSKNHRSWRTKQMANTYGGGIYSVHYPL